MRKWCVLLVLLAAWLGLGHMLLQPQQVDATAHPSDASPPRRIVSMAPNLTEIVYALGLGQSVAAATGDSDYPPEAADKPSVGSFWLPNVEAVIASRPDLVLTLEIPQQRSLTGRLQRMGYNCVPVRIWTVEDLFDAIATIGNAAGQAAEAETLVSEMREKIGKLNASVAGRDRPRVLWVVQIEPLRVAGRDTFINELIELAGGQNAIGPTLHKYPPIGSEQVIGADVEIIVEPAMIGGDLGEQRREALAYWSRLPNVPAVANDRIYVIEADTVSRLSPRLYEGIEMVARCLWPGEFGE